VLLFVDRGDLTMRILLTGGSGFIGKNIIGMLKWNHEILAPSHSELDLCDMASVQRWFSNNRIDAVIHAAARPGHRNSAEPVQILSKNLHMFANLLETTRQNEIPRFLFLGSGSEYDMQNYRPHMREESLGDFIPADDTGFSKYISTRIIQGMSGCINVRFFGIFGKHEDYVIRFISNAICKTLFDLPITLRQDRQFDYTYIDDGVRAIERFLEVPLERLKYNDYNVTPDETMSLLGLAELVRNVSGKKDLPILVGAPGEDLEYSGNNQRFKDLFPDFEFISIENSVRLLYNWYASHIEMIDRNMLLFDK